MIDFYTFYRTKGDQPGKYDSLLYDFSYKAAQAKRVCSTFIRFFVQKWCISSKSYRFYTKFRTTSLSISAERKTYTIYRINVDVLIASIVSDTKRPTSVSLTRSTHEHLTRLPHKSLLCQFLISPVLARIRTSNVNFQPQFAHPLSVCTIKKPTRSLNERSPYTL